MENIDYVEEKYMPDSIEDVDILNAHKLKDKCIFRIELENNAHGTGFLCKLPFGGKNKLLPVLITNNHVINQNIIDNSKIIIRKDNRQEYFLYFNEEHQRRFYTEDKEMNDITIIEILHEDNIEYDSFLEVEDNYHLEEPNKVYQNSKVYAIHFPKENKASLTTGIIEKIEENEIFHSCSTEAGSSGCPILTLYTNKIIGIHKGYKTMKNFGIFIKSCFIIRDKNYIH